MSSEYLIRVFNNSISRALIDSFSFYPEKTTEIAKKGKTRGFSKDLVKFLSKQNYPKGYIWESVAAK